MNNRQLSFRINAEQLPSKAPVFYTHLTLPTIYPV